MNILIVDDNPTNVMLIREILRKAAYKGIHTAASAREMYKALGLDEAGGSSGSTNELGIDLILLDMMMPEIDGLEACRHLQTIPHLRDIPIIMVTAIADANTLAEALDAGAVDYVTKPINRIELLARIRLALRLKHEKDWHKERDRHIREELRLAASVQYSVLSEPYTDERIQINAIYQPSEELAGDLYAWFPLDEHRYGILIMDMMGHGVSSALLCMFIASSLRNTVLSGLRPDQVMQSLNNKFQYLHMSDQLMMYYMTAIYVIVDTENHTITYANAGHPPGLIVEENGSVIHLDSTGHPVGMFPELEIEAKTIPCPSSYRLALYTDGLFEAADELMDDAITGLASLIKEEDSIQSTAWQQLFQMKCTREDDKCLVWAQVGRWNS